MLAHYRGTPRFDPCTRGTSAPPRTRAATPKTPPPQKPGPPEAAAAPANAPAKASADPCRSSPGCAKQGTCTSRGGACVAAADADCRASEWCKWQGACSAWKGSCVARSVVDCRRSEGCRRMGMCALTGTFCSEGQAEVVKAAQPGAGDDEWYYLQGKNAVGPLGSAAVKRLFKLKTIDGRTLLWRRGQPGWQPPARIAAFADVPLWYYLDPAKKKVGPLSTRQIKARVRGRKLPQKTLLWRKGFRRWRPLLAIPELNDPATWDDPYRGKK